MNKAGFSTLQSIKVAEFFIEAVNNLQRGSISFHSPLEEIVLKVAGKHLAYIDNRRDAVEKYGHDPWSGLDESWLIRQGIGKEQLYSKSDFFPDFLFKVRKEKGRLAGGILLELKDSRGGSIASFNSTLPTKTKSLQEIDVINGGSLVSRIASIMDRELSSTEEYLTFQRKCFYLVRTHKDDEEKVKLSLVDGSFFETVPKEHLFHQMFSNILQAHLQKGKIKIPVKTLREIDKALAHITDQTIIAASQAIQKASVKPRLRVMAEVHPEGNPHSSFYPEIIEGSFNLIVQATPITRKLTKEISSEIPEIEVFSIYHKRNGEHIVFQF